MARKRLTDILLNSQKDQLERSWSTVKAADDQKPIPSGEYRCRVVNGELFTSRSKSTPGFKITLEVLDGEHVGRRVWHDVWLSEAALAMAKRDLTKLGIEHPSQLERPLPEGIIIAAKVASVATMTARITTGSCGSMSWRLSLPTPAPSRTPPPTSPSHATQADDGRPLMWFDWASTIGGADVMKTLPFDIGFRVVGHKTARRRAIRHAAAFAAYADCDSRADIDREAYLSHFTFDTAFAEHLEREGSEAAYGGRCGASWLWWDVDRPDDLEAALSDARRLCGAILARYGDFDEDDVLVFLSGGKGLHVGLPACGTPSPRRCSTSSRSGSVSTWRKPPGSWSMARSTRRPGSSARRTRGTQAGSSSAVSRSANSCT